MSQHGPVLVAEMINRLIHLYPQTLADFTTKEVGQGTGQGLAICHSIICDQHSGDIELHSIPGEGTTFYITLPLSTVICSESAP